MTIINTRTHTQAQEKKTERQEKRKGKESFCTIRNEKTSLLIYQAIKQAREKESNRTANKFGSRRKKNKTQNHHQMGGGGGCSICFVN
jgi:hypothetical protein